MGIVGLCGRYGLLVSLCVAYFLFFFFLNSFAGRGMGEGVETYRFYAYTWTCL